MFMYAGTFSHYAFLGDNSVVENSQNANFNLALLIMIEITEIRQKTDQEIQITCFCWRRSVSTNATNVGNRNESCFRFVVLNAFLLLLLVLLLNALLMLNLLLFIGSARCLIDDLFARLISCDVLLATNNFYACIVVLLNILRLLLDLDLIL